MSNAKFNKIRFGVMCNSSQFKLSQAMTIRKILLIKEVELSLIIFDDRIKVKSPTIASIQRAISEFKFKNLLWFVYNAILLFRTKANKVEDLTDELSKVPRIKCKVRMNGKFSELFAEKDVSTIREYKLDFILRFGFGILKGEILNTAKFGIWSFHHDDELKYRGGPPCFWEIYQGDNVTGTILQRITEKLDSGIVLKKGYIKTKLCYVKNRDQMFFESTHWPAQICIDILNGNAEYVQAKPSRTSAPIYHYPIRCFRQKNQ